MNRRALVVLAAAGLIALAGLVSRAAAAAVLGSQAIEAAVDRNPPGLAEAFRTTASASGTVSTLTVYVDVSSTATSLVAGLYADSGGHPGALLGQGKLDAPTPGAWNDVPLPGAAVTAGSPYWIALLGPGGTLAFRDRCCGAGTPAETSAQTTLGSLPSSWSTGSTYRDGPVSAYGAVGTAAPVLVLSPATLTFGASVGGPDPAPQQLTISNGGSGLLDWSATADAGWITVVPASGTGPATVGVSAAAAGLAPGAYSGTITVSAAGAQPSTQTVGLSLVVAPDTQAPSAPSGLAATATGSSVALTWAASADNVGVVRYDVYRSATPGFATSASNRIAQTNAAAYTDAGPPEGTSYYLVAAEDAAGNLSGASNQASATLASGILLGDQAIEPKTDFTAGGLAEAFRTSASTSGTVSKLAVYVDATSSAAKLTAGLYADAGGHPGSLLGQGTLNAPIAGAWNDVTLAPLPVTAATTYWIAVLAPTGTGTLRFRNRCCGGGTPAETSARADLAALPSAWTTGAAYKDGPLSAWAGGAGAPGPAPDQVGQWSAPAAWPIVAVHMSLLPTGNVLAFDAWADGPNSQRIWNPANGTFTPVPNPTNTFCSGHLLLPDGRTLIVGGNVKANQGLKDTTIFDSSTNTWSKGTDMSVTRWYPTATVLGNGKVFVFSGDNIVDHGLPAPNHAFKNTAENSLPSVYDPATNTWNDLTAARLSSPLYPFLFQLSDGRILDAGPDVTTRAMNPAGWTWSTIATSPFDGGSAVMYRPDKVMKSGSYADPDFYGTALYQTIPRTAVIDMSQPSPAWRDVAPMNYPRAYHNLTLLPDGTVLASGGLTVSDGVDLSKAVLPAEIWDPTTETWKAVAPLTTGRGYHSTALLLPDGRVLMAGGGQLPGRATNIYSAEIYSPPYLFKGARPTIAAAPATAGYGSTFTVTTPDAAGIQRVALIRTPSVTHGFDQNQRYVPLSFTKGSGQLAVQAPASGNVAPPGYYMLFVVDGNGVPSVASFVRFLGAAADTQPPTAPSSLTAMSPSQVVNLSWSPSTDDVGVATYDVYRSTTSGFAPSALNLIGQTTATNFADSGAAPGTYYYVVRAEDATGNLSPPSNEAEAIVVAATTPPPTAAVLLGDQLVEPKTDLNAAGLAEAFQTTATSAGALTKLAVYVDSTSTATALAVGLYADSAGRPGSLLTQGTIAPTAGTWNDLPVPATQVAAGTSYWVAVLSPAGAGTIRFRDRCCGAGSPAETSSASTLTALPATWTTGTRYRDGPLSAYGAGGQ